MIFTLDDSVDGVVYMDDEGEMMAVSTADDDLSNSGGNDPVDIHHFNLDLIRCLFLYTSIIM